MSASPTAPAPPIDFDAYLLEHDGRYPQAEFYASQAPYAYMKAGRGCGKTTTLLVDAIKYAEDWPGSTQLFTEPTWQMVERVALPLLSKLYGGTSVRWTETAPVDIHVGPSLIWMAAADSIDENRVRGMNLSRLLMDEAAQGRQEATFHLASACVRDMERPNQRKLTSTPQGRNWLWRMFTGPNRITGVDTFLAYSIDAERCGLLPEGWVNERAIEYGGWQSPLARQELLAQELEMAGQVHPEFRREVHVRTRSTS